MNNLNLTLPKGQAQRVDAMTETRTGAGGAIPAQSRSDFLRFYLKIY